MISNFYELGLVLEVFGAEAPTVGHFFRILDRHSFDFGGQDGAESCKRELVNIYDEYFTVDDGLWIIHSTGSLSFLKMIIQMFNIERIMNSDLRLWPFQLIVAY